MSFSENDNSFSLSAVPLKSIEELNAGLWLVLVGVNETPPHIALISEGKYYSLSIRKVDCGTPLERFINVIERKQVPTLFVHLQSKNNTTQYLGDLYKDLQPLENTETTCLSPIKELFAKCYSNEFMNVNYVFELLAIAQKQGLIGNSVSLFCENSNSNIVTLPKYTLTQIQKKIQELSSQQIS